MWNRLLSWAVAVGIVLLTVWTVAFWLWQRSALVDAANVAAVFLLIIVGSVRWMRSRTQTTRDLDDRNIDDLRGIEPPVMEGFRTVNGRLPRVGEMSLADLRVKPSIYVDGQSKSDVVYIDRDKDQDLYDQMLAGGLIVVRGPSGAGKSRMAAEAARKLSGERLFLVPENPSAVRALAATERSIGDRSAVLWLDDLERFLVPDGLDRAVLDRLSNRGIVIVSTLRQEEWANLDPGRPGLDVISRQIAQLGMDVLSAELTKFVDLDEELSGAELIRAEEYRSDPRIALALDRAGARLTGYLAGGPQALERWNRGTGQELVPGQAIISAAVDCRRAGYNSFLSGSCLEELCRNYIPTAFRHHPALDLHGALLWASEPARSGTAGCLTSGSDGYQAVDYLLDRVNSQASPLANRPIPDAVWSTVVSLASVDEALEIANAAYFSGRLNEAKAALRIAAHAAAPMAGAAMFNLGVLAGDAGDRGEAETWFLRAAEAGHAKAMFNVGCLLQERDEIEEAEKWWRRAIEARDANAMVNLGNILRERGETQEAETLWRRAVQVGEIEAMVNLGTLLSERGDSEEAERLFRSAADVGNSAAMFNWAKLLEERGDRQEAERLWRRAAEAGESKAMMILGIVLLDKGEGEEAEQWFHSAAEAGNSDAMFYLGILLMEKGEAEEAEKVWRHASEASGEAATPNLGILANRLGKTIEAERWFRKAAEAGSIGAMAKLGYVLTILGRSGEAQDWLKNAAEKGSVAAMVSLGYLLVGRSEHDEAEQWWRAAAEAGDATAMFNLGVLFTERGDGAEAERWWRRSADGGFLAAMRNLAALCSERGESEEAERWRQRAEEVDEA